MTDSGNPIVRFASANPPDAVFARIQAAVATTPASTFGTRSRILAALAVASSPSAAVILIASHSVYHRYAPGLEVQAASSSHLILILLLLIAQASVVTVIATRRGQRGFGSGVLLLYLVSGLVAPIYAALVMTSPVHAADFPPPGVVISPLATRCVILSAIIGVVVLASFTVALRRSVPAASMPRGAAIGAAAGAWAGLSVFIFCPSGDLQHLFIGHVLPIVALTLLGISIVPRALRL